MSLDSVNLLGIRVTTSDKKTILEELEKFISGSFLPGESGGKKIKKTLAIVTPNPEQIVLAQKDKRFGDLLNQADIAIPDGVGVVVALRFLRETLSGSQSGRKPVRLPGVDLMQDLIGIAGKRSSRIALIGGHGNLAINTFECLSAAQPRLSGVAMPAPELVIGPSGLALASSSPQMTVRGKHWRKNTEIADFSLAFSDLETYVRALAGKLSEEQVQYVFVALGAPKQEFLIKKLSDALAVMTAVPVMLMSVGGSFDIISGNRLRAPLFIRSIGFEWFWRLLQEPWRWRRQLALGTFFMLVVKAKVQVKRS